MSSATDDTKDSNCREFAVGQTEKFAPTQSDFVSSERVLAEGGAKEAETFLNTTRTICLSVFVKLQKI